MAVSEAARSIGGVVTAVTTRCGWADSVCTALGGVLVAAGVLLGADDDDEHALSATAQTRALSDNQLDRTGPRTP